MRDPFSWSFPLFRWFGIQVKVHVLFPFIAIAVILREVLGKNPTPVPGGWIDASIVMSLFFLCILLHEFGHCFAARSVGGDANEVLLWPLGGLANVDLPYQPRAHFLTAAAGPATNLVLGAVGLLVLRFVDPRGFAPSWNPFGFAVRESDGLIHLHTWGGDEFGVSPYSMAALLAAFVWVNYVACLLNVVLVGFPLDGGRMLQSALWPIYGYRQAMFWAVLSGFVVVFAVGLYALVYQEMIAVGLALFVLLSSQKQWYILETGADESLFGYDFSQGYTSLERDLPPAAPPRPRRASLWQQWRQKRLTRRLEREQAERVSDERRMDELLEKVQREGITALTDEERRFMKRVSDRYRNRH
jgi:Zn-dependent protease